MNNFIEFNRKYFLLDSWHYAIAKKAGLIKLNRMGDGRRVVISRDMPEES